MASTSRETEGSEADRCIPRRFSSEGADNRSFCKELMVWLSIAFGDLAGTDNDRANVDFGDDTP